MFNLKLKGAEISIGTTANCFSNATCVRIINTGVANVLHLSSVTQPGNVQTYTEYANCTVSNTESAIIYKAPTDVLQGNGMLGVQVALGY